MPRNRRHIPRSDRIREMTAAARRVFLASGYADTTIVAIAQEAGVAANAVRWYFPHKDDALAAVINDLVDTHLATLDATDLDALVVSLTKVFEFRRLAPAVADRAAHSPALAACSRRVHELIRRAVEMLVGNQNDQLVRDSLIAVIENQLTNPQAVTDERILRYTLERLLPA